MLTFVAHPALSVYYRPNGNPALGHVQAASLTLFASVANARPSPDFPPGWVIMTVNKRRVLMIAEDSGVRDANSGCISTRTATNFVAK